MDVLSLNTRAGQLIGVRQRQIQIRTSGGACLKPSSERFLSVPRRTKRVHDFPSDLAATCAQARPNGGQQIGRSGCERFLHRADRRRRNSLDRTSPSRMGGADGPAVGVG